VGAFCVPWGLSVLPRRPHPGTSSAAHVPHDA